MIPAARNELSAHLFWQQLWWCESLWCKTKDQRISRIKLKILGADIVTAPKSSKESLSLVTFTGSRSASRTDKRPLSSYRTVPDTYAASPLFVPSTRPSKPVNVVQPVAGGGFWPPPVVFPQRQATTPDPGELNMVSAIFDDFFKFFFHFFFFFLTFKWGWEKQFSTSSIPRCVFWFY